MRRLGWVHVVLVASSVIAFAVLLLSAARTRTESLSCAWVTSSVRCEISKDYWIGRTSTTVIDHVTGADTGERTTCDANDDCDTSLYTVLLRDGRPYETTVGSQWAARVTEIVNAREGRFAASEFRPFFLIGLLLIITDAMVTAVVWVVFGPARRARKPAG